MVICDSSTALSTSHRWTTLSHPAVAMDLPSWLNATAYTGPMCPLRVFHARSVWNAFHSRTVLSDPAVARVNSVPQPVGEKAMAVRDDPWWYTANSVGLSPDMFNTVTLPLRSPIAR